MLFSSPTIVEPVAEDEHDDVRLLRRRHEAPAGGEERAHAVQGSRDRARGDGGPARARHLPGAQAPIAELREGIVGVGAEHDDRAGGPDPAAGGASRRLSSFLSRTSDSRAALRLTATCSSQPITLAIRSGSLRPGFSKSPMRNLSASTRRTVASSSRLGQEAMPDSLEAAVEELRRGHDEIVARLDGQGGGLGVVGADALVPHEAAHVVVIGDEHAFEAPLLLEHFDEQPAVDRRGQAVDGLVARHEGHAALAGSPLEGREEIGSELAARELGLGGVTAAQGLRVAGVMLGGGKHGIGIAQALALVSADHRRGELADEVGVLAEGLVDPAPAQVPRDAEHRRECPLDARRAHLPGRRLGATRWSRAASQLQARAS